MIADELRRQADVFIDIVELQHKIGRDPSERPAPPPSATQAASARPAHAQFLQRPAWRAAARRCRRRATTNSKLIARPKADAAGRQPELQGRRSGHPSRAAIARSVRGSSLSATAGAPRSRPGTTRRCPSFGPLDARLLIVGLAPGLHGANRTGRPFTGDYAGDLLYATLMQFGFANGKFDARPDDGLSWSIAASPMRCAACRRRTSRRRSRSTPAGTF